MNTHTDSKLTAPPAGDRNHGVGTLMRRMRRQAKGTHAQAAEAIGLGRTSMCNIERGTQALTIEKLVEFADFMGVNVVISFRQKRGVRAKANASNDLVLGSTS